MSSARSLALACALAGCVAGSLSSAASAHAVAKVVAIRGGGGPGPAKYDRVFVSKFGPASARKVLVLVPGSGGGAGDLTLDARELAQCSGPCHQGQSSVV